MTIFTVHVPRDPVDPRVFAERAMFVPEGFAWGAFLFAPLWLLWNRLWLGLAAWIVAIGLVWFLSTLRLQPTALFGLVLLLEYFFGLEGNGLLASALRHRGLVFADIVEANGDEAAEHHYFRRALPVQTTNFAVRRAPPARGSDEFVGLSPDAGR